MKKSLSILILLASITASQTVSAWPFHSTEKVGPTAVEQIKEAAIQRLPILNNPSIVPAAIFIGALFSFAHAGGNDWQTWFRNCSKLHNLGFLACGAVALHTKNWLFLLNYLAGAAAVSTFRVGHGLCEQAVKYVHSWFSVGATPNAHQVHVDGNLNVDVQ